MTFTDAASEHLRRREIIQKAIRSFWHRRLTRTAIARLDNRMRADVGLPPVPEAPVRRHEAAVRIALLAFR
jgi:hypothetical protein